MLSTECGLCGVLQAQVAEPQGVLSHLPMVHSHPVGSGGFWALEWEIWFSFSLPADLYIWSPPRPSAKSRMAVQQVSGDRNSILPFPPPNFCLSGLVQEIGWWPEHNQGWVRSFFLVSCFWG